MSARAVRPPINSSATNVFEVLRLVSESEEPLGVAEISRRLGLPASTVYRALITLEESEYISRYQNSPRYVLGPLPRLLSRSLFRRFALHRESLPSLRRLARETGETTTLSVRLGWYSLRLAVVYGGRDFYHRARLGEVTLLHANLSSRAIMAFMADDEIAAYWRFVEARHPEADTDHAGLAQVIAEARRRRLVIEPLAMSPGHCSVSLPLFDPDGRSIASLALNGPVLREGDVTAQPEWVAARDQLEAAIKADPARFRSPFAGLNPDEMFIRLPAEVLTAG